VSLGEVTASMAHEFNNPLGIIKGFVQEMLGNANPANPEYRSLQIINEETERCKKIVEDLMEYSRPGNVAMSMTDVHSTIEKSLELVETHCYKQKVEVAKDVDSLLPPIYADSQQLTQVMVNLYLNAIDAMPDGGGLSVSARAADPTNTALIISVTDTGMGIEKSEMGKIFQPFYTAKKRRGLGLGLPICERIVKNHGGEIKVQSRPGLGTTFEIHLPAEPNPEKKSD
jgi:two-component system, NtrC family, sensor kinase